MCVFKDHVYIAKKRTLEQFCVIQYDFQDGWQFENKHVSVLGAPEEHNEKSSLSFLE